MCVLCLYGRRGSFTGVWAHSPALGDSQDLSEAGSPAARGGRLWRASHHLIITAAPWKRSRTEIGQIWKGWDATTIFSKSYKAEGSPHADFSLSISSVPPGVPEAELPNGSRREQHALKTLKKKVSPSADHKFHFRQLHKKKKKIIRVWLLRFSELAHNTMILPRGVTFKPSYESLQFFSYQGLGNTVKHFLYLFG